MSEEKKRLSISEVNTLQYDEFIATFGNVIEHCALCPAVVWGYRPFRNYEEMQSKFDEFLDQLPISNKAGILRLYIDLAGKRAQSDGLSPESVRERATAGLGNMTDVERQKMSELNAKYKNLFDFPFVICARQNRKEAILLAMKKRLINNPETEAATGVNEVKKICRLRLRDLVDDTSISNL